MTSTSSTTAARRRANTTLAAAAAEAAAAAAALAASSTTHSSSTFASIHPVDPLPPHAASGEVVETLYSHPAAKIISFNAGARNYSVDWGASSSSSASSSSARGRSSRRSTIASDDNFAPGTLPWSSQFERTIAVSSLSIYRAPGSVAFLSCGSALQPILPKSQCWCIDEESSKFILQIRRPQFWRIEIPVGDDGENDELARRFRDVLDHVLQFEKTPCPFKRSFTVELPQQPSTPPKKKPWTPVKRTDYRGAPSLPSSSASSLGLPARPTTPLQKQPQPARPRSSSPVSRRVSLSPSPSPQPEFSSPDQPIGYTRREWAAVLERRKNDKNKQAGSSTDEYDDEGNRIVPALVAEHERIIMEVKASEIEVNKMGTPWRKSSSVVSYASTPPSRPPKSSTRDRSLSLAGDSAASRPTDWPTGDRKWAEVLDSDVSTTESSPMNSIRSWLSPASGRTMSFSSPVSSTDSLAAFPGSGADSTTTTPAGLTSLVEDARRLFNRTTPTAPTAPGSAVSTATEVQQPPRYRHRATTSSISVSNIPQLPPAVNILTPARHLRSAHASGRATTRLEAVRRIPGSIMYRVLEIMLAPPSYLISLMLRVAARILSGEWRGFAVGKTDAGESIPVEWDYSDVEDPFGFKAEKARRRAGAGAGGNRPLGVFAEADDDDSHVFSSSSSTPKRHTHGVHTDEDDAGDDRIVWTRRWAVD